jgi:hypothetical protein
LVLEWKRARQGSSGKSLEFYVLAEAGIDIDRLPDRAWLGVDPDGAGSTVRLVSAAPARLNVPVRMRPPERHPGMLAPHQPVSVKTATRDRVSFARA